MKDHFRHLLFNLVSLVDSLVGICSLGFIQLDLDFKLALLIVKRDCKKSKDKLNESK